MTKTHPIHEDLKSLFKNYFEMESVIIAKLQEAYESQVYKSYGYSSLYQYVVAEFGVSESRAYLLIGVSKKCSSVPELKDAIDSGKLTASQAKRILPVVDNANSSEWIQKAIQIPQKDLERLVAIANPESTIHERIKPVSEAASEFTCKISPELESKLLRAREVTSQKLQRQATWEEALGFMTDEYLERRDPVRRAERILSKPRQLALRQVDTKSISANLRHRVAMRDKGGCRHPGCNSKQWTDIHHIIPLLKGGSNTLENLITLCRFHHDMEHGFSFGSFASCAS